VQPDQLGDACVVVDDQDGGGHGLGRVTGMLLVLVA
jgi:hypothetical protein